jgi:hypothetical protein
MKDNTKLKFLGIRSNQLGKRTANAMLSSLTINISLTTLQIDKNPDLEESVPLLIHVVQSNRAGRYLLGQKDEVPRALWTLLFEQLECDMLFFFLTEHPELVIR